MKSTKNAQGVAESGVRPTKATYKTPRLEVYGDVGEITRSKGGMGAKDGGMGAFDKTAT